MAAPSTGFVFFFHHLTEDVIAMYAAKSGKEKEVKKCPTIELPLERFCSTLQIT